MVSPERFHDLVSGQKRGPLAGLARGGFWLASLAYGIGVNIRNRKFERRGGISVGVPVVSVGNLTLGGTGKTPFVEWLARFYRDHGARIAILSRGYGAEHGPNDEALVLEENLPDVPHLQNPDRVAIAQAAIEELESELLILDDGFQHRRLHRDLDIVLIDATSPWGFGHLFPRGLLREPRSSLKRAGAIVLTKCDQCEDVGRVETEAKRWIKKGVPIAHSIHRPLEWHREGHDSCEPTALQDRPAAAFCGLGNPESFRRTLASMQINPMEFRSFPDHHSYTRSDVEDLRRWADQLPSDAVVLTTQKDMVKLRLADLAGRPLWALRIGMEISQGREELQTLVHTLIA